MMKTGNNVQEQNLDFFVVGAEKCGTTWLAKMLMNHPQVYIPPQKELHYFNRKFVEFPTIDNYNFDKPISWYRNFFKAAERNQILGEICPAYLWDCNAPSRIKNLYPHAKIIIILRDPVERAFSAFRFYKQRGVIPQGMTLRKATEEYHHHIITRGMYYDQVKRYISHFGEGQVHVFFMADLKADPNKFLLDVEYILGVKRFLPKEIGEKKYVTGTSRIYGLNKLLSRFRLFFRKSNLRWLLDLLRFFGLSDLFEMLRKWNKTNAIPTSIDVLEESDKVYLFEHFLDDIKRLEKLLDMDLIEWNYKKLNE